MARFRFTWPGFIPVMALVLYCPAAGAADVSFPRSSPAFVVTSPRTPLESRASIQLTDYLTRVLKKPPTLVSTLAETPANSRVILLVNGQSPIPLPFTSPPESPEGYALGALEAQGRQIVVAVGTTDQGVKRAVQRLIIESRQEPDALVFPETSRTGRPWISQREWTVCPWAPRNVRGVFVNPRADLRMDIYRYSEQQLADYAAMFDWFGFNGCQLMETAYSYAAFGSIEAFQDWQRRLAGAVRSNGQAVSLWVWAAQFSGFDWYDPQVVALKVPAKGAFNDPATRSVFEKYYDGYARLAPLTDRLIGHFYDPGVLTDRADVFKYMRLLEQKFTAKNPKVHAAIDLWAADPGPYMQQLVDNGFGDYVVLASGFPAAFPGDARRRLHEQAKSKGIHLGIWGWYLTEYETDQLASMYVNAQMLKNSYQMIKKASEVHPIEYWSEMEAHHLNNIYSMYVASQLLWNPDQDPHALLKELTFGIWGPTNGPLVLDAVELIQDMRSGPTWETYWWGLKTNRIGSVNATQDFQRVEHCLSALTSMKPDADYVSKFPLPFPPETFVELMIPHLQQIRLFAEFRLALDRIREASRHGADKATLQKMLDDGYQPIPEFDTWVGVFGTPEFRAQDRLLTAICDELKLARHAPAWLRHLETDRVYQCIQSRQRATNKPYQFQPGAVNEFFWSDTRLAERIQELQKSGLIESVKGNTYRLTEKSPGLAITSQNAN